MKERKPNGEVRIRPYESSDQEGVAWLYARTPPWGRTYPRPQPLPEELESPLASYPHGCFVAIAQDIAGEALVGFTAVSLVADEPESLPDFVVPGVSRGRIDWFSVAPELWRLGIGRRLIATALERLGELGCQAVVLETTIQQEGAIAFYESVGFHEVGRTQNGPWRQVWLERGL